MPHSSILEPVVVLVAWSLVMWLWMYATRIPAIQSSKMKLDPEIPSGQQMASLPSKVRWKADNYNHLFEQPTIFYAITLCLAMLGQGEGVNAMAAWAYVGLRIVHSVFQATTNIIVIRFLLFVLSTIPLFVLTINAVRTVF